MESSASISVIVRGLVTVAACAVDDVDVVLGEVVRARPPHDQGDEALHVATLSPQGRGPQMRLGCGFPSILLVIPNEDVCLARGVAASLASWRLRDGLEDLVIALALVDERH
eukprot:8211695-Alexandrium_andersonii.AAC.1